MKASGILTGTDYLIILIVSQGSSQVSLSLLPLIHSANHSTGAQSQLPLSTSRSLLGWEFSLICTVPTQQLLQPAGSLPTELLPCPTFLPDTQDYTGLQPLPPFSAVLDINKKMKPTEASSPPRLLRVKSGTSAYSALNILCTESSLG